MDKLDLILEKLEKLESEVVKTNLTIENEVKPQINLLAEGQSTLLSKLAPRSEVEDLREEVEFLKSVVRTHEREIQELKKAQ